MTDTNKPHKMLDSTKESVDAFLEARQAPLTTEAVLADPSASLWLLYALKSALERDPVDAANDAEVLAKLLGDKVDAQLRKEIP